MEYVHFLKAFCKLLNIIWSFVADPSLLLQI